MLREHYDGQIVAVAVLDQETCAGAADIWPMSFEFDNPDIYLTHVEDMTREIADSGGYPFYVFIDPAEYVEWCRSEGQPVDSAHSRVEYASTVVEEGGGIPYDPDQPLWPLGIANMVFNSDLGSDIPEAGLKLPGKIAEHFTNWVVAVPGTYRAVVTASRYAEHNEDELWRHFRSAIMDNVGLTHCDDYLSVQTVTVHRDNEMRVPNYGRFDPVEQLLHMSIVGHGIFGVEHRAGRDMTFRAWNVNKHGRLESVDTEVLGRYLGTPGAPSLRSGWPQPENLSL